LALYRCHIQFFGYSKIHFLFFFFLKNTTVPFWTTLFFFFPFTHRGMEEEVCSPVFFLLSLFLPTCTNPDKTHTTPPHLPLDEKIEGTSLRAALRRQPSGRPATLPLCHDWTRVVALSPSFPFYKYQGKEMSKGLK